ncbi:MAG TPA: protein phosphatase CheZ [Rhodanobacteraceae bacterium]|nr:protein phosphatase CheZ [Oleiagrimonas sp.]HET9819507.1 protein phosphatase CheZ [Rhodanobacteraceae bacterium]
MSVPNTDLNPRALPPELRALLETRDSDAFEASLDALFARRQSDLFRALGHLTRDLHKSIVHLTQESGQPPAGAPFARQSLQEALAMSAGAAHETLAMAERLRPRASRLGEQARAIAAAAALDPSGALQLARDTEQFAGACLDDFTRLVEQQSWQDLSGQRLQRVSAFIDTVEHALLELVRLTGTISGATSGGEPRVQAVSTQDEVDRLLSDFGF